MAVPSANPKERVISYLQYIMFDLEEGGIV